jgi:TPR repeat protein/DNA-binding transcriptional ArsR family regulator
MLLTNTLSHIYNPLNQNEEEALKNFVVRQKEFQCIFNDLKGSAMSHPEPHYIIQGQRGQGKTTLLLKLYYEIRRDNQLNRFIIPLIFKEEQYYIGSLFDLWEHTAEVLEEEEPGFQGLYEAIDAVYESEDAEPSAFKLIEKALKDKKKKLVLLLDNIGQLLDKLEEQEHHRLREILQSCAEIRIIGASAKVLEYTFDYSKPFYELFRIITLEGLSEPDTVTLLLNLGEYYGQESIKRIVANEPGRIEALRRLTGGVPRTIILLFEIFVEHENGGAFQDLELVLDRVSPLYKHRMDDLPPQQQKIVDAIAMNWDAMGVKEIAGKTRMESKAVSSQLKLLERNRIIHKVKTSTKNYYYQVTERFFNIWYLMRYGKRHGKNRVQWLVHFLQEWCSREELFDRTRKHIDALKKGKLYPKHALYFSEALAATSISEGLQHEVITRAREFLEKTDTTLLKELSKSDLELFEEADKFYKNGEFLKALSKLEDIQNKNGIVFYDIAFLSQTEIKDYQKAEEYYQMAVEKGHTDAMNNLALLYHSEYKDYQNAEKYYRMAVAKGDTKAMYNLALLYADEYKNYQKAEKYYRMAVEKGDRKTMYNLAPLYHIKYKDYQKAELYYRMAVEKGLKEAMYNLALLYHSEYQDYEKAEEFYLMAVEKGFSDAMNNLAYLYFQQKKNKAKALSLIKESIKSKKDFFSNQTLSLVLLWNNQIEDALKIGKELWEDKEVVDNYPSDCKEYLLMLMAKKQYYAALKLFEESPFNLKDRHKPIYYTLMYFLKDEYPNEYIKMGEELKQTIEEIIAVVRQWEKDYA